MMVAPPHRPFVALLVILCTLAGGCSRLRTEYGQSYGAEGQQSIAGFGVLRDFYRRQGWSDRTVARLSERLNNVDAIVWTPKLETAPSLDATEWFEEWMARGDKTLIYVLRDHETIDTYWQSAAPVAEPDQRLEYRRRQARARMDKLQALVARPAMVSNGWFTAVPTTPPALVAQTGGAWSDEVFGFKAPTAIEYQIRAYDAKTDVAAATAAPFTPFNFQSVGFTETEVDFEAPLASQDGIPMVASITAEAWNGSRVLVVAGGSLLTNFGLLDPGSRRLAARLVAASTPPSTGTAGKVGFLYTDESGVNISTLDPQKMGPSGMELLTAWPLSLITIHGTILAFVICLVLFPIFGRPRRLRPRSSTDFADHVRAVAALMSRAHGIQYAKVRISEYMVRVRGETTGAWVIEPPPKPTPPPELKSPLMDTPVAGGPTDAPPTLETR